MKMIRTALVAFLALAAAVQAQDKVFTIGMSQCNLGEPWRVQMNADIKKAADAQPSLKVIYKDAQNDTLKQRSQIEEFVSAGVVLSTIKGAVLIPAQAVQRGPDGDFVYRVRADKAEAVTVKVGVPVDDYVVLDSGLTAGDEVVVEGQIRLYPGAPVAPRTPGKPAGAAQ